MRHLCLMLSVSAFAWAAALDGVPVHYTATGSGPKTVILVHGWTCDESSWSEQAPALSKTYRVVTVDLPGHGKTPLPKDGKLSMDVFAQAIEAVRAEVKADRVVRKGAGPPGGFGQIFLNVRIKGQHPDGVGAACFLDRLNDFRGSGSVEVEIDDDYRWALSSRFRNQGFLRKELHERNPQVLRSFFHFGCKEHVRDQGEDSVGHFFSPQLSVHGERKSEVGGRTSEARNQRPEARNKNRQITMRLPTLDLGLWTLDFGP